MCIRDSYDVRGPVADEAARMEAAGTHILKLNIGNPAPFGFRTPDEVVYDMAQQLPETEGYSPSKGCLLYTSDAADEEDSVDLGGPRVIKKKKKQKKIEKKEKRKRKKQKHMEIPR